MGHDKCGERAARHNNNRARPCSMRATRATCHERGSRIANRKFWHWTCMQVLALDLYASSGIGPVCKFGCMFHVWHEMRFLVRIV